MARPITRKAAKRSPAARPRRGSSKRLNADKRAAVERAKKFINTHYASIKSIRSVARAVSVDYEILRKLFSRIEGISLLKYLQTVRVMRSLALLRSKMKQYHIARELGYSSESLFIHDWKKFFPRSPKYYKAGLRRFPKQHPKTRN